MPHSTTGPDAAANGTMAASGARHHASSASCGQPHWRNSSSNACVNGLNATIASAGVARPTAHRTPRASAQPSSSPTRRDLPIPGGPVTSIRPPPADAAASASRNTASSVARPTVCGQRTCTRLVSPRDSADTNHQGRAQHPAGEDAREDPSGAERSRGAAAGTLIPAPVDRSDPAPRAGPGNPCRQCPPGWFVPIAREVLRAWHAPVVRIEVVQADRPPSASCPLYARSEE